MEDTEGLSNGFDIAGSGLWILVPFSTSVLFLSLETDLQAKQGSAK